VETPAALQGGPVAPYSQPPGKEPALPLTQVVVEPRLKLPQFPEYHGMLLGFLAVLLLPLVGK
jgi:hypothetical protein